LLDPWQLKGLFPGCQIGPFPSILALGLQLGKHIGKVRGAQRWAEHEPYFERAMQGKTVDLTGLPPEQREAAAARITEDRMGQVFDLARLPLAR